jgi:hypothetical protein
MSPNSSFPHRWVRKKPVISPSTPQSAQFCKFSAFQDGRSVNTANTKKSRRCCLCLTPTSASLRRTLLLPSSGWNWWNCSKSHLRVILLLKFCGWTTSWRKGKRWSPVSTARCTPLSYISSNQQRRYKSGSTATSTSSGTDMSRLQSFLTCAE